ncbi:interaptin-like [Chiloscyllium plagiosum]|uniref:interaptin-like n=1 Tax=Chiloscyllium plagiosum TaxID=36176 RepID=UPI001CB80F68|nr:interaptin-like [Chiloscyllium plagiosum]
MSGSKQESRGTIPHTNSLSKSQVRKLLQKYKSERDEATRRGEISRDKLRAIEAAARARIQELREKVNSLNSENKSLNKRISKLQPELRIDANPRLRSKLTREVLKELKERAERCKHLLQENARLNQQAEQLAADLVQAEHVRKLLEDRLQVAQSQLKSLASEHDRVLKLCEEGKAERGRALRLSRLLRESLLQKQQPQQTLDQCIQTTVSIPIYRRFPKRIPPREATARQPELHRQAGKMKQRFVDRVSVIPKENRSNTSAKPSASICRMAPN